MPSEPHGHKLRVIKTTFKEVHNIQNIFITQPLYFIISSLPEMGLRFIIINLIQNRKLLLKIVFFSKFFTFGS